MVLPNPSRPMSVLLVSKSSSDGNVLRYGLQDALGKQVSTIELSDNLPQGAQMFLSKHHDIVLVHGWSSSQSEAFILQVRRDDGRRHTGVIVMADPVEGFDKLVVDNYAAGADEVVPSNLSLAILRSKMIMVSSYKITTDLLRTANHKLQVMAITDELTGCANMRGFTRRFASVMAACEKGTTGVAVMMMDLDHFKRVNDQYNHLVGSHVIRATGQLLLSKGMIGEEDLAARYGGDEFVVLLKGNDPQVILEKASRIRKVISETEYQYEQVSLRITASIGVAWVGSGFKGQSSDLVKAADAMLYRSKEQGRNKVSGMVLKYPLDFTRVGEQHLLIVNEKDATQNTAPLKKVGK